MEIIIRIPEKRYQGPSKSGKCHNFLTSGYGGKYYSIPVKALSKPIKHYQKQINTDHVVPYIEITFQDWAFTLGTLGESLKDAINDLKKYRTEAQVIGI
tara:strand:+ start:21000 stop:21296 length:297 start_codon:yes stop_codon:yes gene_type:complete